VVELLVEASGADCGRAVMICDLPLLLRSSPIRAIPLRVPATAFANGTIGVGDRLAALLVAEGLRRLADRKLRKRRRRHQAQRSNAASILIGNAPLGSGHKPLYART
jgi:hypothetical protein